MFKQFSAAVAALALVGVMALAPDQAVAKGDLTKGAFLCHFDKNDVSQGKVIWVNGEYDSVANLSGSVGMHLTQHNDRKLNSTDIPDDYVCGDGVNATVGWTSGAACPPYYTTDGDPEIVPLDCTMP